MITRRRIIQLANLGILGYQCVDFEVLYSPGTSDSGRAGPPEKYDPGKASEIYLLKATLNGMDITSLIDSNSGIYDQITDDLYDDDLDDRRELAFQTLRAAEPGFADAYDQVERTSHVNSLKDHT